MIRMTIEQIERQWVESKLRVSRAGPQLHKRFALDVQRETVQRVIEKIADAKALRGQLQGELTAQQIMAFDECLFVLRTEMRKFDE